MDINTIIGALTVIYLSASFFYFINTFLLGNESNLKPWAENFLVLPGTIVFAIVMSVLSLIRLPFYPFHLIMVEKYGRKNFLEYISWGFF